MRHVRLADAQERNNLGGKAALEMRFLPHQQRAQARGRHPDGPVPCVPALGDGHGLHAGGGRVNRCKQTHVPARHRLVLERASVSGRRWRGPPVRRGGRHVRALRVAHAGRGRRGRQPHRMAVVPQGEHGRLPRADAPTGTAGPVGVRRRPLLPEGRGPGVAGHGGATLPGAHAAQHVHRPDAQPQERGRPRTARPHQETAPHPRGRAGRRMDGGTRRLAHAPRRLHQGTHVRQGRSRQPQGQGGAHMVVDP